MWTTQVNHCDYFSKGVEAAWHTPHDFTSSVSAHYSPPPQNLHKQGHIVRWDINVNAGTAPHLYTLPRLVQPRILTPLPQPGTALEIAQFYSSAVRVSGPQDLLYLHISSESQMLTTGAISSSKNNFCRS